MDAKPKRHEPRTDARIQRILGVLKAEAMTCTDLAEALCMSHTTAKRYLQRLRAAGQVYIAKWVRPNGWPAAVYRTGNRKDAPEPKQTKAQYVANYRISKPKVRRDPLTAWIPKKEDV